jgi:hypothetical protein
VCGSLEEREQLEHMHPEISGMHSLRDVLHKALDKQTMKAL